MRQKVYDDVRLGRAVVLPRSAARAISGLRLSPLGAVVSPAKVRIIHDLPFNLGFPRQSQEDNDFESAPVVKLQHVLRDVYLAYVVLA